MLSSTAPRTDPCISAFCYWPSGRLWPINHDPLSTPIKLVFTHVVVHPPWQSCSDLDTRILWESVLKALLKIRWMALPVSLAYGCNIAFPNYPGTFLIFITFSKMSENNLARIISLSFHEYSMWIDMGQITDLNPLLCILPLELCF